MQLVSPGLGVITTWNCARNASRCVAGIAGTEDLGRTWTELASDLPEPLPINLPLSSPTFLDPEHGWVVADDCAGGRAWLYRTDNAGATWHRTALPTTSCNAGSGNVPAFVSPDQGWVAHLDPAGPGGALMSTDDGGATWTRPRQLPSAGEVTFSDPIHGWLAEQTFGWKGSLYRTTDAGASWQVVHPPLPPCCTGWKTTFLLPAFSSPSAGVLPIALLRHHRRMVAFDTTSDGGTTWSLASVLSAPRPLHTRRWVATPTSVGGPSSWWIAAGNPARVFLTTNGGATWRSHRLPAGALVGSIDATGPRDAFLTARVNGSSELFATDDGGRTWRPAMPRRGIHGATSFVPFMQLPHPVSSFLAGPDGMLYAVEAASSNGRAGRLIRIDPVTRAVTRGAVLQGLRGGPVDAAGGLWTATGGSGVWSLDRIDPGTLQVVEQLPLARAPASIASAPTGVWVGAGSSLSLVDAASGSVVRTFALGSQIGKVAASPDGSVLYVTTRAKVAYDTNPLLELDAATGTVLARTTAGFADLQGVAGLTPTGTGVWVTFATGMMAVLSFFQEDGLTPGAIGNQGANSLRASLAGGELWLTEGDGSGYQCVDPNTGWSRGSVLRHHPSGSYGYFGGVAATPAGAFAVDGGTTISRIVPPPGCPVA